MDIRITGAPSGGEVKAIPSKSAAHRVMIAAAMSGIDLAEHLDGLSEDITATKRCLQAMTAADVLSGAGEQPDAVSDAAPDAVQLPCGESGSTLRFLIPLAGVLGLRADFICEGRLPDRPMEPLLEALSEHGCTVSGRNPKQLSGRLTGGEFRLPGNVSSQYVTGLLMALPLAGADSRIVIEGDLQSRPYIDLTLSVLAKAGLKILETAAGSESMPAPGTVFFVPGGQRYELPEAELEAVEGDWSNAAFWLTMDAMNQDRGRSGIHCTGLDTKSRQGDRQIVPILERMRAADALACADERPEGGIDISVRGRSAFVEIDASDIPDLVPIISAFASGRPRGAVTHIVKAGRLRLKESDRLASVTQTLRELGADITEEPEGLMIRGSGRLYGGEVSSHGDHRIVMMAAACACITEGEIVIHGAEAVNKSYPRFFEDYRKLGGQWEWL